MEMRTNRKQKFIFALLTILARGWGWGRRDITRVNAQTAFFVDVAVAHGDHDGVSGDIHHNYIEDLEADAQVGDGDNVEAAGTHGESLEEAVEDAEAGGKVGDGGIVEVEQFEGEPVDAVED